MAREINAGDLSRLPAGCIVVFGNTELKEGTNERKFPGHCAITNGNGQMYSDEIDNSNWDNFVSKYADQNGKGEHGYVRIFKLNSEYFELDEYGYKLVKK